MDDKRCTSCGASELQPGWMTDQGQGAKGYAGWIAGPLERGLFGAARQWGKPRLRVDAFRCPSCGHLELFVTGE